MNLDMFFSENSVPGIGCVPLATPILLLAAAALSNNQVNLAGDDLDQKTELVCYLCPLMKFN
jgi:hypothetical protein